MWCVGGGGVGGRTLSDNHSISPHLLQCLLYVSVCSSEENFHSLSPCTCMKNNSQHNMLTAHFVSCTQVDKQAVIEKLIIS